MPRFLLLIVLFAPAAVAAPVPKVTDADRIAKAFGTPVDPDKDCTFDLDGDKLKVAVPGKAHSLQVDVGRTNAPRAMRPVAGDFVATVRARVTFDESAGPADPDLARAVGVGLVVADGDDGFVEFRQVHEKVGNANPWRTAAEVDVRVGGTDAGGSKPRRFDPDPVWLRLTRSGETVTAEWSTDGKRWTEVRLIDGPIPLGKKLAVGPYVYQNTDKPVTAVFDQFTVVPGGK